MRKLLLLVILLPLFAIAQSYDSQWLSENYIKKEIYIPMRDGVKLFTSVYVPKSNSEKHPILLSRTPYSCAPYGATAFKNFASRGHYKEYLKEGYIMISQDVRGRWMSEGNFVDIRPFNPNKKGNDIDESTDTYDTIDWLVKNLDNNNGNVGVFGISYPGFYATMAALCNHPALKAVSPQAPVTDWFMGDDFHHNGAFMAMDAFSFYSGFGKPRPKPTTVGPAGFIFPTQDTYEFYLRNGIANLTKFMGDSIAFWNDLVNHPNYDAWWQSRNPRNFVQNISPNTATLEVGGLFDAEDCFGAWNVYKSVEAKAKNNNKVVIGPWYHGQWASGDGTHLGNIQFESNTSEWYAQNIEVPFFNYYLKGKGSVDKISEANIFFTGENKWRQLPQWPAANMKPTDLYLQNKGGLSFSVNADKNSFEEYTSDPSKPVPYTEDVHNRRTREYMTDDQRFAARRTDVLTYQTAVLTEDVTVGGPLTADLRVSISTTDADFVVKLIDVFPDDFTYPGVTPSTDRSATGPYIMNGYQMLVRGDVMRGKFRNSFEKPEPFVPGKPTQVKYTMPDIAHTFKKGHRIMVQVQSSWFPLVDRNPQKFTDINKAGDADFQKATIKIYANDSKIILPIIK